MSATAAAPRASGEGAGAVPEIRPIDASSRHRICSGQVILDLATAVKELVENAADAGATSIEVRLKEYGADLVEVADNGSGVDPAHYKSLTLKHWTSKIRRFEDLESVASFGFRGEALSSLCAMASVVVTTRTAGQEIGARVEYDHAGAITKQSPAAREAGTTVALTELFKNMPVRAEKFKRDVKKEYQNMLGLLQGYAVILSGVRLTVSNHTKGSRQVALSSPGGTLRENVASVFGSKQLSCLDDFAAEEPAGEGGTETLRVTGLVSKAAAGNGRGSGDRQYLFLNGRPVEVPKIAKAINEAYKAYNAHQYPVFILDVRMDRAAYDVNLVPDKRKVMIHDLDRVLTLIRTGLASLYEPSRGYDVSDAAGGESRLVSAASQRLSQRLSQPPALRLEAGPQQPDPDLFSPPASASSSSRPSLPGPSRQPASPRTPAPPASGPAPRTTSDRRRGGTADPFAGMAFVPKHARAPPGSGTSTTVDLTEDDEEGEAPTQADSPGESVRLRCDWGDVAAGLSPPAAKKAKANGRQGGEEEADQEEEKHDQPAKRPREEEEEQQQEEEEDAEEPPARDGEEEGDGLAEGKKRRRRSWAGPPGPGFTPDIAIRVQCDWAAVADDVPWDPAAPAPVAAQAAAAGLFDGAEEAGGEGGVKSFADYEAEASARRMERVIAKEHFARMRVVGQFNLGFIIAQLGSDLFIVDQHASDEKFRFETLRRTTALHVQPLIRPLPLELTAAEEAVVAEHRDAFAKNGFEVAMDEEAPPGRRARLTARPQSRDVVFGVDDAMEIVAALREGATGGEVPRPARVRAMLASRACRSAIMVGDALSPADMAKVVRNMGTMEQPWNCPHGRPTMRHLIDVASLRGAA